MKKFERLFNYLLTFLAELRFSECQIGFEERNQVKFIVFRGTRLVLIVISILTKLFLQTRQERKFVHSAIKSMIEKKIWLRFAAPILVS